MLTILIHLRQRQSYKALRTWLGRKQVKATLTKTFRPVPPLRIVLPPLLASVCPLMLFLQSVPGIVAPAPHGKALTTAFLTHLIFRGGGTRLCSLERPIREEEWRSRVCDLLTSAKQG